LAGFSRHRLTDALQFVKKNADYSLERLDDGCQRQQLHITGVFYSQKFASAVETELSLRSAAARPTAVCSFRSHQNLSLSLSLSLSLLSSTFYSHICKTLDKTGADPDCRADRLPKVENSKMVWNYPRF